MRKVRSHSFYEKTCIIFFFSPKQVFAGTHQPFFLHFCSGLGHENGEAMRLSWLDMEEKGLPLRCSLSLARGWRTTANLLLVSREGDHEVSGLSCQEFGATKFDGSPMSHTCAFINTCILLFWKFKRYVFMNVIQCLHSDVAAVVPPTMISRNVASRRDDVFRLLTI